MKEALGFAITVMLTWPAGGFGQSASLAASGESVTFPVSLEGKRSAAWGGDSLLVPVGALGEETDFQVYDVRGKLAANIPFSIPDADHTYVYDFARGVDGTLAICGLSFQRDGRGGPFLAIISSDGLSQHIVRTAPYAPNVVGVAPDGTLWTVGREVNERLSEKSGVNLDAAVLRHFDRSGKSLGAFVARSSIEDPTMVGTNNSYLAISSDRVGWLRSMVDGKGAYVEVSAQGGVASYPLPERPQAGAYVEINGLAMTDAGEVFTSVMFVDTAGREVRKSSAVFRLDRAARAWFPTAVGGVGVSSDLVRLYGVKKGTELAVWARGDSPATVRFLAVQR